MWPERCASSKCRKRSWNKSGHVASVGSSEITLTMSATEGHGKTAHGDGGMPSIADLRKTIAAIESKPFESMAAVEPERPRCAYTEYDEQSGETYGCALYQHSAKVKHVRGPCTM